MLTCHVDPHPLSDGLLVDSHWAGGPLQLPQGDTYKLVDSVETSPSNSCTSRGGMRGTGSRFAPYPLPCQGRLRRAGPLALLPPWGEVGALKRPCLHPWITSQVSLRTHTHTTISTICKNNDTNVWQDAAENCCSVLLQVTDSLRLTIIVIINESVDYFPWLIWYLFCQNIRKL